MASTPADRGGLPGEVSKTFILKGAEILVIMPFSDLSCTIPLASKIRLGNNE
jgi:hypothetical protein